MPDEPVPRLDHRMRVRLERIALASALGVLALGIGIGALFAALVRPIAPELVIAGIAVHGWGMFRRHRLERDALGKPLWWVEVLYWLCWLLLLALTAYLV